MAVLLWQSAWEVPCPRVVGRSRGEAEVAPVSTPSPVWPYGPRWRALGRFFGTYAAELADAAVPALAAGAAFGAGATLAGAQLLHAPGVSRLWGGALLASGGAAALAGVLALAAAGMVATGHAAFFKLCRRRCRGWGLRVCVLVPESPALARRLHRRVGLELPVCAEAYSVHVDGAWRAPRVLEPGARRALFGQLYRADYDQVLSAQAGRGAVLCSSTFNRHESALTLRAAAQGSRRDALGPLLARQPARHSPGARRRQQRRMFGAVLTERRVDRPDAWRVRVFDGAGAAVRPVLAGDQDPPPAWGGCRSARPGASPRESREGGGWAGVHRLGVPRGDH